jgi:hypothetical protein
MSCGGFFSCLQLNAIDDEGWDDVTFSKLTKMSRTMILDKLCMYFTLSFFFITIFIISLLLLIITGSIFKDDSSFSNFNDNEIHELLENIQERRLKPSQYVYRVGDGIDWFYYVVSGTVEIKELNITIGLNKIVNADEVYYILYIYCNYISFNNLI